MGRVVLACKSDEEERKAARATAFPYSLLTDRRCFCSCDYVGIRSVHTARKDEILLVLKKGEGCVLTFEKALDRQGSLHVLQKLRLCLDSGGPADQGGRSKFAPARKFAGRMGELSH